MDRTRARTFAHAHSAAHHGCLDLSRAPLSALRCGCVHTHKVFHQGSAVHLSSPDVLIFCNTLLRTPAARFFHLCSSFRLVLPAPYRHTCTARILFHHRGSCHFTGSAPHTTTWDLVLSLFIPPFCCGFTFCGSQPHTVCLSDLARLRAARAATLTALGSSLARFITVTPPHHFCHLYHSPHLAPRLRALFTAAPHCCCCAPAARHTCTHQLLLLLFYCLHRTTAHTCSPFAALYFLSLPP